MKIHCIGIGGIGLSGIAQFLKARGHDVSGSDAHDSQLLDALRKQGIEIFTFHDEGHVSKDVDMVIHSVAISGDNPELARAKALGLPIHTYSEALGAMSGTLETIAVCGTHGKTTTTGMLYSVFRAAGKDPSALIGSLMKDFDHSNVAMGNDDTFIVEACEYRGNFLPLHPRHILCTNIELDHVDYFQTEDHYFRTFKSLLAKVGKGGIIAMRAEDSVKVGADYFPASVIFYDPYVEHLKSLPDFQLQVFGEHNYQNAAAVFAFADAYGISQDDIMKGLAAFSGTARRMEPKGTFFGAEFFDDYAHHPSEIHATLGAFRQRFPGRKIYVVFQPHQHSRARYFLDDFGGSLQAADTVIIPNIYAARDTQADISGMSASDFVASLAAAHPHVLDGGGIENTAKVLEGRLAEGDMVVVMGAGDVNKIFQFLETPN